jgi:hypothetical protein
VHDGDLKERYSPAGPVIAPEPNDGRRRLFLPGIRLRAVLFASRPASKEISGFNFVGSPELAFKTLLILVNLFINY